MERSFYLRFFFTFPGLSGASGLASRNGRVLNDPSVLPGSGRNHVVARLNDHHYTHSGHHARPSLPLSTRGAGRGEQNEQLLVSVALCLYISVLMQR